MRLKNFTFVSFTRSASFFLFFTQPLKFALETGAKWSIFSVYNWRFRTRSFAVAGLFRWRCGRDKTASLFSPLTWRLRLWCSWGLRVGLLPGFSRARRRYQKVGSRFSTAWPADQVMERMEVDQCAGAGGGALRRSNSAPMIASVRFVVLHSYVYIFQKLRFLCCYLNLFIL